MNDLLHKLLNFVDHYRYTVIGLILCGLVLTGSVTFLGCQSRTMGLLPAADGSYPAVTRPELERQAIDVKLNLDQKRAAAQLAIEAYNQEVAAINSRIQAGVADLDRQDEIKAEVFAAVSEIGGQLLSGNLTGAGLATAGLGLLGVVGTILGIGATADSQRKDRVIAAKTASTTGPTTAS